MTAHQSIRFRSAVLLGLLTSGLITVSFLAPSHAEVLYKNNFEDDPVGTYTDSNLTADWNSPSWNNGVDEGRVAITNDANTIGQKSLVVTYPKGETTDGKSQWKLALDAGYEELYLSYRIRFDNNFDFVRGGKLPGLIGGTGNTGGKVPNGSDGWSARMMWRTDGSSGSQLNPSKANLVQYVYHPDQPETSGEDFRWDDTTPTNWQVFESDVWYHLQHRVVMNTPGQKDGIIQAWLNGQKVLDVQNLRFRDVASLKIDQLYFSTFFGGNGSSWEPSKDQRVYFDDFVIATDFITTPGDLDGDGDVDNHDLDLWESHSGTTVGGDTDGDLDTDGADFLVWQRYFTGELSPPQSPSMAIPELSTGGTLLVALLALFSRRKWVIR